MTLPDHPLDEKYHPSNGTEGDIFMNKWCANCKNHSFDLDDGFDPCEILGRNLFLRFDDPDYPSEWIVCEEGPTCTAFIDAKSDGLPMRCDKTIDLFQEKTS